MFSELIVNIYFHAILPAAKAPGPSRHGTCQKPKPLGVRG